MHCQVGAQPVLPLQGKAIDVPLKALREDVTEFENLNIMIEYIDMTLNKWRARSAKTTPNLRVGKSSLR